MEHQVKTITPGWLLRVLCFMSGILYVILLTDLLPVTMSLIGFFPKSTETVSYIFSHSLSLSLCPGKKTLLYMQRGVAKQLMKPSIQVPPQEAIFQT